MQQILFTISSLVMIVTLVVYIIQVVKGDSVPNPATWLIAFVMILINTVTYYFVLDKNGWSVVMPTVVSIGIAVICGYSIMTGKMAKVGWVETVSFLLTLVIGGLWLAAKKSQLKNSDETANGLMQFILLGSFVPTILGLVTGKHPERALAWNLAVVSYCFQLAATVCGEHWRWTQLLYPFLNGVVGNGSVAVAILLTRHKFPRTPQVVT